MTKRCISLNRPSKQRLGIQILFLVTCSSFMVYSYWKQLHYTSDDATELCTTDSYNLSLKGYTSVKRGKGSTDSVQESAVNSTTVLKYILFWTWKNMCPFRHFKEGQTSFIISNCSVSHCYATTNRTLFKDVSKFDAIAFNGCNWNLRDVPKKRSRHQKYIFYQREPADSIPVCDKRCNRFFNWTSTYRLDSDIVYPYFSGKNLQGDVITPQINKQWPESFPDIHDDLAAVLANKTKAAAWFVSHCSTRSHREQFVKKLQLALRPYGHTVDIYGECGPLKCPKRKSIKCNAKLKRDYFFYLSFENTIAVDYVTEKLQTALQNDVVPIVLGGADYSRYIPPGSYINSKDYNATSLAAYMDQLMKHPEMYKQFFRWKSHYTYDGCVRTEHVCALCAALNNKEKFETETVQTEFRKWWLPNYIEKC